MKPIERVEVISTGEVEIRPEHVRSSGKPTAWWLLTSRKWTAPRPINVYVIQHEKGLVLFDTGQDRRSVTDPEYFPKGLAGIIYRRLARFAIAADQTLTSQLAGLGYEPSQVDTVVLSHLHQDHIGGLAELKDARILVSAEEWATLDHMLPEFNGLLTSHIDLPGLHWDRITPTARDDESILPFDHSYDIFEDGSLILVPTPGHTPGSLSMLLRQDGLPPILFVGDLTYDVGLLDVEGIPGIGNRQQLLGSTRAVNQLKQRYPDLVIAAAHDPGAAKALHDALRSSKQR